MADDDEFKALRREMQLRDDERRAEFEQLRRDLADGKGGYEFGPRAKMGAEREDPHLIRRRRRNKLRNGES